MTVCFCCRNNYLSCDDAQANATSPEWISQRSQLFPNFPTTHYTHELSSSACEPLSPAIQRDYNLRTYHTCPITPAVRGAPLALVEVAAVVAAEGHLPLIERMRRATLATSVNPSLEAAEAEHLVAATSNVAPMAVKTKNQSLRQPRPQFQSQLPRLPTTRTMARSASSAHRQ